MISSTYQKTSSQGSAIRGRPDEYFVIARCQIPAVSRFVERLQDSRIDRNCHSLRFAGSKRDVLPPDQPFVGFVCAFRKLCVHFSDFCACPFTGVLDSETHSLPG